MAQSVNLGGGIGPAFTAALKGYKSGTEFHEAREREERQAAIDAETLRGANARNTHTLAENERNVDRFKHEMDQETLETQSLEQGITLDDYRIKGAERVENTEAAGDHLRGAAEIASLKEQTAVSNSNRATAVTTGAEAWREGRRNEKTAQSREDAAVYTEDANKYVQERAALVAMNDADVMKTYGTREAYDGAKVKNLLATTTNMMGMLANDPTGKGVVSYLNGSKNYKVSGAVSAGIDDDGFFRVKDKDGNVVLDHTDADNDGKPDPLEFDTRGLSNEMLKKYFPANWERMSAQIEAAGRGSGSGSTEGERFSTNLSKAIQSQLIGQYDWRALGVSGEMESKPLTANMEQEYRTVLDTASRLSDGGMDEEQAMVEALKHPELVSEAAKLTGFPAAKLEQLVNLKLKTARDAGKDATRLMVLNQIVSDTKAFKESQSAPATGVKQ